MKYLNAYIYGVMAGWIFIGVMFLCSLAPAFGQVSGTITSSPGVTISLGSAGFVAGAPTFSPAAGSYSGSQCVTLSSVTGGSSFYYTTDGTTPTFPTTGSTQTYSGCVTITGSSTLTAIAVHAGYTTSAPSSAAYTITGGFAACPQTSGGLTVNVSQPRALGISPLFVFYDATTTTDSSLTGTQAPFNDVTYTWNFGDAGASGTGTWAYGSRPGVNSMNAATGGIAGHLYIVPPGSGDKTYTAQVTAKDAAGNSVTCLAPTVTAYDPSGGSGFAGASTICVAQLTLPVAGAGGCPAGAAVATQANYNAALTTYFGNGKRVLFKCGETFTGTDYTSGNQVKWHIGAYGGCEGTTSGRPIFNTSSTSNGAVTLSASGLVGDGRITDIDCEGAGTGNACVNTIAGNPSYQVTLYNLNSTGNKGGYAFSHGAQWAMVALTEPDARGIAVFFNFNANDPPYTGALYTNLNYQALLGSSIVGQGGVGTQGIETVRVAACRMCVFENNSISNSNSFGSNFKFHNGNTHNSLPTWTGIYTELTEVSDNNIFGKSNSVEFEFGPENGGDDERLRNIVIERNIINGQQAGLGGRMTAVSGVNITLRDNLYYIPAGVTGPAYYLIQATTRGIEPQCANLEIYNNVAVALSTSTSPQQAMIGLDPLAYGQGGALACKNSVVQNNLFYTTFAGHSTVVNVGTGNTVSNNTATSTNNPAFTNGSGNFSLVTDFKPTANFSGALNGVPVVLDALGVAWSPTWDLGAVHH